MRVTCIVAAWKSIASQVSSHISEARRHAGRRPGSWWRPGGRSDYLSRPRSTSRSRSRLKCSPLPVSRVGTASRGNCSLFAGWHYQGKARFPLHSPSPRGNYCSYKTPKASSRQPQSAQPAAATSYPAFQKRETRQQAPGCVRGPPPDGRRPRTTRWRGCAALLPRGTA